MKHFEIDAQVGEKFLRNFELQNDLVKGKILKVYIFETTRKSQLQFQNSTPFALSSQQQESLIFVILRDEIISFDPYFSKIHFNVQIVRLCSFIIFHHR